MDFKAKQSRLLQVAGIILIIWGIAQGSLFIAGLAIEFYEITLDGIIMIQGYHWYAGPLRVWVPWTRLVTEVLVILFGAIANLIAGIKGIANWKKPERANTCLLWGIAAVAVNALVIFVFWGVAAGVGSLAIHVLYIAGVYRLKELGAQPKG